jgi:hypothetical protein
MQRFTCLHTTPGEGDETRRETECIFEGRPRLSPCTPSSSSQRHSDHAKQEIRNADLADTAACSFPYFTAAQHHITFLANMSSWMNNL